MEELTEGTDVDKMSLPQGWKWVKLSDVATVNPKLPNKDSLKDNLEIQFLPMRLVEEVIGKIHLTEVRKYSDVQKSYTSFVDGDVIFAKVTPCMENGKIAVVENLKNGIGFGSSEFHVIRPSAELNNKFLFNYLVQNAFRNGAKHEMTGAVGLRRVPKQFLENHLLPLPPPQEQRAIVSKIEELFSELDKGKQQLELAQQQLKVYRQAVLKWAFEGRLTYGWRKDAKQNSFKQELDDILKNRLVKFELKVLNEKKNGRAKPRTPKNIDKKFKPNASHIKYVLNTPPEWSVLHLAAISDNIPDAIVDGPFGSSINVNEDYVEDGVPVIRINNILQFAFDKEKIKFINKEKFNELRRHNILPGDVLFGKVGTIGNSCIYPINEVEGMLSTTGSCRIRIDKSIITNKFLCYYLNSKKSTFNEIASAAVQAFLNMETINNFPIPICSLQEQDIIVQEIESRLSVCDKVEETINQNLAHAETLRQSILKKAFEGKLLTEAENNSILVLSKAVAVEPLTKNKVKADTHFPKVIAGIKDTDLHAGILAMVIDAHEKSPEHHSKLSHIKGEKIAHLVEAYIGIDLGRTPRKDAAGPDDYPHLKKVESRATKAGWFRTERLHIGQTYISKSGMPKIIKRVKEMLPTEDLNKIEKLIQTFLPFELEHAEVIATVYAGWNNLLLDGRTPTDEEIVFESRENWSKRKLSIEREKFFNALHWLRKHEMVPVGVGKTVNKPRMANGKN